MHLDDLFGDGKTETRTALGLGVRAVHLMELFEDAGLVLCGNTGASICHADGKVAIGGGGAHAYLPGVGVVATTAAVAAVIEVNDLSDVDQRRECGLVERVVRAGTAMKEKESWLLPHARTS